MFLLTYIGGKYILQKSYLTLEDNVATDNITRVYGTLNQLGEIVANVTSSWSLWDDAYQFAIDKNAKFVEVGLAVPVIAGADVDIAMVFGPSGDTVFLRALNSDRTKEVPMPQELINAFKPNGDLWHLINNPTVNSKEQGLYSIKEGILILSTHAILTSKGEGPPHGTMVLAKYFTDSSIKKIRDITQLNFDFYPLSKITTNPELNKIYNQLISTDKNVLIKNEDRLISYSIVNDINGNPIAIFKLNSVRTEYLTGVNTIKYFNAIFIISGLILSIILFYLFKRLVTGRLRNLNDTIVEIEKNNDFSIKVPQTGSDELASVGIEVNKMLNVIKQHNEEKQNLIDKRSYELSQTNLYSQKLHEIEKILIDIINSMPSILVIADENLNISHINLQAEKFINANNETAKHKSVFQYFPFLKNYEALMRKSLQSNQNQVINKITYKDDKTNEIRYYSVLLYLLSVKNKDDRMVIRIDDITEHELLNNRIIQNNNLASLGVLTAGVAHEINNPINFVSTAINPLKHNISEIFSLIVKYNDLKLDNNFDVKLNEVEALKKDLDIDYLLEETLSLLDGIRNGALRTAAIVRDLKSFARSDEDTMGKYDVEEGIDSTLTLLYHKYKNKIKITKNYEAVPKIDCFAGKLNQVFMNVLSNSIDAIPQQGEIKIKTETNGTDVIISIKDNGVGIDEKYIKQIFDPFFTTKEVGSGTGLGLSITHNIVQRHHGTIDVKSELGKGTEFIIVLPINHIKDT